MYKYSIILYVHVDLAKPTVKAEFLCQVVQTVSDNFEFCNFAKVENFCLWCLAFCWTICQATQDKSSEKHFHTENLKLHDCNHNPHI